MGAVGNNGLGVVGTNWTTSIVSISICTASECDASTAVTGIDAALQIADHFGLRIVAGNLSHGTLGGTAMQEEMSRAGALNGIDFVASTGDECNSDPDEPASFHLSNEIAVSASDQTDQVSHWSGSTCSNGGGDVAAPGSNIYTTLRGDNGNNPIHINGTSPSAPFVTGALGLLASACPLDPAALIATLEGTADQKSALTSIATNGRRLNLGNALESCAAAGHTVGSGSVQVFFSAHDNPVDTGTITITIDGRTAEYSYDTSVDTRDTVGQGLTDSLNGSPFVNATYLGGGQISIVTTAKGHFTGYSLTTSVLDDCGPNDGCGPAPSISSSGIFAGN